MNFAMTDTEKSEIDVVVENMISNLQGNQAITEQLALDSVRLLSCTEDNYNKLQNQGFFKRCWSRMSGETGKLERENTHSLIEMQKIGFRYINMLQQNQLLTAHSILTLKNNLNSLAIKEAETQQLITDLAKAVNDRFIALERRVDECETNVNLQGWLLTLEERELENLYPTPHIRLLEVVNQFYQNKSDNWNNKDLLFMRKALRTVSIDPKQQYSVESFIKGLVHEIIGNNQFPLYEEELNRNCNLLGADDNFIIDEISSPLFMTMHSIKNQYEDRIDSIEELKDELNISTEEALSRILCRKLKQLNININYSCPIAESGIEILGAIRLTKLLSQYNIETKNEEVNIEISSSKEDDINRFDINSQMLSERFKDILCDVAVNDILEELLIKRNIVLTEEQRNAINELTAIVRDEIANKCDNCDYEEINSAFKEEFSSSVVPSKQDALNKLFEEGESILEIPEEMGELFTNHISLLIRSDNDEELVNSLKSLLKKSSELEGGSVSDVEASFNEMIDEVLKSDSEDSNNEDEEDLGFHSLSYVWGGGDDKRD